jgi:hypothetical protein
MNEFSVFIFIYLFIYFFLGKKKWIKQNHDITKKPKGKKKRPKEIKNKTKSKKRKIAFLFRIFFPSYPKKKKRRKKRAKQKKGLSNFVTRYHPYCYNH